MPLLVLEGRSDGVSFRSGTADPLPAGLAGGAPLPVEEALSRLHLASPARWFGFLGYELGWAFDALPPLPPAEVDALPDLRLAAHDWWVEWGLAGGDEAPCVALVSARLPHQSDSHHGMRLQEVLARLEAIQPLGGTPEVTGTGHRFAVTTSLSGPRFREGVQELKGRIRAGDIFQANLTHTAEGRWEGRHLDFHRRLRQASPAPWSAWLEVDGERSISSVSPEGFLEVEEDRVRSSPIKGTAPRGADGDSDLRLARGLAASQKDRAENVMITDLLRNDLSRVAVPGSVRVPRLAELESHPSVHHLVSDVEARLAPGRTLAHLLRATFPGGSITGAPKLRAMELLAGLEPVRRGVYTGAIGWLDSDGRRARLNIAIRTATLLGERVLHGTGGGITLASNPRAEWVETLDKAAPFLQVLGRTRADLEAGP
ncbi:MAG: anthranilate synthase component I family protein [Gemmatimonadales bacterium]|nr:MAG: anthranilate synthase component I family protein [Gemmatimonadales bacterium]